MSLLVPARRPELRELLDDPSQSEDLVRGSYADIRTVNRRLGGLRLVRREMHRFLRDQPRDGRPLLALDVGAGTGDVPEELVGVARGHGRHLVVLALDRNRAAVREGRDRTGDLDRALWLVGDALRLPLADGGVDYALCALTAHHLGREGTIAVMREMDRVSRRGWLLNDLRRHRLAWAAISVLVRLCTRNPLTRWDGPASVLRSFTLEEMREMAEEAGFPDAVVRPVLPFRILVRREK